MAYCTNCGAHNPDGNNNCTNCGAVLPATTNFTNANGGFGDPVYNTPMQPAKERGKGMAIASLVCSIVGLISCGYLVFPCSILGLIFGIIAKKQGSKSGMATAGLIMSVIAIAFFVILFIIGFVIGMAGYADVLSDMAYYY